MARPTKPKSGTPYERSREIARWTEHDVTEGMDPEQPLPGGGEAETHRDEVECYATYKVTINERGDTYFGISVQEVGPGASESTVSAYGDINPVATLYQFEDDLKAKVRSGKATIKTQMTTPEVIGWVNDADYELTQENKGRVPMFKANLKFVAEFALTEASGRLQELGALGYMTLEGVEDPGTSAPGGMGSQDWSYYRSNYMAAQNLLPEGGVEGEASFLEEHPDQEYPGDVVYEDGFISVYNGAFSMLSVAEGIIKQLQDYPVLDEGGHSELEDEALDEELDSWAVRDAEKQFGFGGFWSDHLTDEEAAWMAQLAETNAAGVDDLEAKLEAIFELDGADEQKFRRAVRDGLTYGDWTMVYKKPMVEFLTSEAPHLLDPVATMHQFLKTQMQDSAPGSAADMKNKEDAGQLRLLESLRAAKQIVAGRHEIKAMVAATEAVTKAKSVANMVAKLVGGHTSAEMAGGGFFTYAVRGKLMAALFVAKADNSFGLSWAPLSLFANSQSAATALAAKTMLSFDTTTKLKVLSTAMTTLKASGDMMDDDDRNDGGWVKKEAQVQAKGVAGTPDDIGPAALKAWVRAQGYRLHAGTNPLCQASRARLTMWAKTPKGFEPVVKELKKKGDVANPRAMACSLKPKGTKVKAEEYKYQDIKEGMWVRMSHGIDGKDPKTNPAFEIVRIDGEEVFLGDDPEPFPEGVIGDPREWTIVDKPEGAEKAGEWIFDVIDKAWRKVLKKKYEGATTEDYEENADAFVSAFEKLAKNKPVTQVELDLLEDQNYHTEAYFLGKIAASKVRGRKIRAAKAVLDELSDEVYPSDNVIESFKISDSGPGEYGDVSVGNGDFSVVASLAKDYAEAAQAILAEIEAKGWTVPEDLRAELTKPKGAHPSVVEKVAEDFEANYDPEDENGLQKEDVDHYKGNVKEAAMALAEEGWERGWYDLEYGLAVTCKTALKEASGEQVAVEGDDFQKVKAIVDNFFVGFPDLKLDTRLWTGAEWDKKEGPESQPGAVAVLSFEGPFYREMNDSNMARANKLIKAMEDAGYSYYQDHAWDMGFYKKGVQGSKVRASEVEEEMHRTKAPVARWQGRGHRYIQLYRQMMRGKPTYGYEGPGEGGGIDATTDEEAIALMEDRIQKYVRPDNPSIKRVPGAGQLKANRVRASFTVGEYGGEGTGDWAVLDNKSNVWYYPKGPETNATEAEARAYAERLNREIKATKVKASEDDGAESNVVTIGHYMDTDDPSGSYAVTLRFSIDQKLDPAVVERLKKVFSGVEGGKFEVYNEGGEAEFITYFGDSRVAELSDDQDTWGNEIVGKVYIALEAEFGAENVEEGDSSAGVEGATLVTVKP